MAYTRVWSNLLPLGSIAANQIDDEFRKFRVDVDERMNTILGAGKWATDPVAVMAGLKMFLHGASAEATTASGAVHDVNSSGLIVVPSAGLSVSAVMPIRVPIGHTITDVTAYFNNTSVLSTNFGVSKISTAGVISTIGTPSSTALGGAQSLAIGAVTEVPADGFFYSATLTVSDAGGAAASVLFYGIRVTITKANIVE